MAIYKLPFNLLPAAHDGSLLDWWLKALDGIGTSRKKDLSSLIMAVSWHVWSERNNRIFNNKVIHFLKVAESIINELNSWRIAGFRGAQWTDAR